MDLRKSQGRYVQKSANNYSKERKSEHKVTIETLYKWLEKAILGIEDQLSDLRDQIEELADLVDGSDLDTTEPLDYTN